MKKGGKVNGTGKWVPMQYEVLCYNLRFTISQKSQFLSTRNSEPRENDFKGIW